MKIFNFQFSIQKGFTLIELMIVLSITAVLGTMGAAGFLTYNKIQVLQSSASNIVTMLNLAKSRAQSQVKLGPSCGSESQIQGYSVDLIDSKSYKLVSHCSGGSNDLNKTILPQNVNFKSPDTSPTSFFFPVQTGGVETSGKIVISDSDGKTRTIIVNSLGGVSIQ